MNHKELHIVKENLEMIEDRAKMLEVQYEELINSTHPVYKDSARNLLHYLALRSFDLQELQSNLRGFGLPDLTGTEGHVMQSIFNIKMLLDHLEGGQTMQNKPKSIISIKKSEKLLKKNTKRLFGYKSKKRRTRIMVTLPESSADSGHLISNLMKTGMNSVRINCAHDDEETWLNMIEKVKNASRSLNKKCKITMDLSGPKLRTGPMKEGPGIIHIKPKKDEFGRVIKAGKVWIAPQGILPPEKDADVTIPVSESFIKKIKRGNKIFFTDTRQKKCVIEIVRKQGDGKWGICHDSAYVSTGTELTLNKIKETGKEKNLVGELLPLEQVIVLKVGDSLILHKDPIPGEPASFEQNGKISRPAHISCTLPEVFNYVNTGEAVFLNDGKIEGLIKKITRHEMVIQITQASDSGSKLKADKGINFPESDLNINGLTAKDKKDLPFISRHADAISYSFVNSKEDIEDLLNELGKFDTKPGLIVKIETRKAYQNLPQILLSAMKTSPVGLMIARGDLAVETGWNKFAGIQNEIMRICEAAHIPVIWATQVLENLVKKGVPTRSEITDAAIAHKAECVMLNKGAYIIKGVKTLDDILKRMQKTHSKKSFLLPLLENKDSLSLKDEK